MTKNKPESDRVAKAIRVIKKQCFYNAFHTLTDIVEYNDADYVEGIAVTANGLQTEHGWVERNGEIIDPTLPDEAIVYFPGLKFHGIAEVRQAMKQYPKSDEDDLPLFYRFGWGGSDSKEMMKAREQASAYCKSLIASNRQTSSS